jgi:hypothetical protein
LSDWFRLGLFGGGLPVSLLFPNNIFYTQPMLILIRYPGSHCHSTPEYAWYQAMVWMHGLGDLISVTNF